MFTTTPSDRIPLNIALNSLPVTHFTVVTDPQKPIGFEKVLACLYRFTSERVFEVLSLSLAEGAHVLLNVAKYDREEGVRFCVWGISNKEIVARLGLTSLDLRMHGEEGTIVDGILLSPVTFPDRNPQARTERLIYRHLSSQCGIE